MRTTDPTTIDQGTTSAAALRPVRRVLMARIGAGVLIADAAGLLLAAAITATRPDPPARPAPVVIDTQCIDGHLVQGIDDHAGGGGLLARTTTTTC